MSENKKYLFIKTGDPYGENAASYSRFILPFAYHPRNINSTIYNEYYEIFDPDDLLWRKKYLRHETANVLFGRAIWLKLIWNNTFTFKPIFSSFLSFKEDEFKPPYSIKVLCETISTEYEIDLRAETHTLEWLNKLLERPDFCNKVIENIKDKQLPSIIIEYISRTEIIRNTPIKEWNDFTDVQKNLIKRLSRLLLEYLFPSLTPKGNDGRIDVCMKPPVLVLFEWGKTDKAENDLLKTGFLIVELYFKNNAGNMSWPAPTLDDLLELNELFRYWHRPYERHEERFKLLFENTPLTFREDDVIGQCNDSEAVYFRRWSSLLDLPI